MMFGIFGHQAPREPLLFLLWMTIALSASEFGAIRVQDEPRSRKSSGTKRDDAKSRTSSLHLQNDFPYRYVFPANHPYSSFTQFLSPPPAAIPYRGHNYDPYPPSINHQQYTPSQPEYKYLMKPQPQSNYPNTQPFSPSVPLTPSLPFHAPSTPMILLVHAGHAGQAGGSPPFQTFVLIPADAAGQQMSGLGLAGGRYGGAIPTLQLPSASSSYGVAPSSPSELPMMPVSPASMQPPAALFRPTSFAKPANSHFHGLLQRPINVYPMPTGQYYPQKKNSLEPRISASEKESTHRRATPSTEANPRDDSGPDDPSFV